MSTTTKAAKQLYFNAQDGTALKKMQKGVDKLAHVVGVTLGPKGRNVVIDKKFGSPTITKDGVTVAKEIELECSFENMGAQMVNEVASKTSDNAGDGTTTATVLAQAIFREGMKYVTAGASPMDIKRGIEAAVDTIIPEILKMAKPTKDKKEIAQVGSISANSDKAIGQIISEAMDKVGKDGVITVEEAKSMEKTALNDGSPFTWSSSESLEELQQPERIAQIKADHAKKLEIAKKKRKINPLRPDQGFVDFDELYGQQKVCLACHK